MGFVVAIIIFMIIWSVSVSNKKQKNQRNQSQRPSNQGPIPNRPSAPMKNEQDLQEIFRQVMQAKQQKQPAKTQYVKADLSEMTMEGDCPPDHQHEGWGVEGGEGGAPAALSIETSMTTLKTEMHQASFSSLGNEHKPTMATRTKERKDAASAKRRRFREAIVWSEVLKRPRFGTLPKDR